MIAGNTAYIVLLALAVVYTMNGLAQLLELMKHDPDAFQGLSIAKDFLLC